MAVSVSGNEVPVTDLPQQAPIQNQQEVPPNDLPRPDLTSAEQKANASEANEQELQSKSGGLGQQALSFIEGQAKGRLGPLAALSAKAMRSGASKLGVPEEDLNMIAPSPERMAAREEANPVTSTLGILTGLVGPGQGALLEKVGAKAAAPIVGEGILKGATKSAVKLATENALYQAGDEVTKMINEDPDQSVQSAIANVGLAGLIGGAGGAVLGSVSPLWKAKLGEDASKLASDFQSRMKENLGMVPESEAAPNNVFNVRSSRKGMAPTEMDLRAEREAARNAPATKEVYDPFTKETRTVNVSNEPIEKHEFVNPFEKSSSVKEEIPIKEQVPLADTHGGKLADMFTAHFDKLSGHAIAGSIGGNLGHLTGIPYGGTVGAILGERAFGPFLESILPSLTKPILEKVVSGEGLKAAADYGSAVLKGQNIAGRMIKSIFKPATNAVLPESTKPSSETRQKLNTALQAYQTNPEKIASIGGSIGHYFPSHATAIGMFANNTINFLNGIRPQTSPQAPLDPPKQVSKAVQSQYNRALDIAQQPMIVIDSIKKGTLTSHDIIALQTMYPSLYEGLRKTMMNQMVEHVSKGDNVPYETRLGLSLFLGMPLDSTMKPMSISSAQPMPQQEPQAPQSSSKKPTQGASNNLLKGAKSMQTSVQASEARHSTEAKS